MKRSMLLHSVLLAALLGMPVISYGVDDSGPISIETLRTQREEAKDRQRRIIVNNDGDDVKRGWPGPATAEKLLAQRTTPLAGTQVDTLCYSTGGISFDGFRHNTKVGRVFDSRATVPGFDVGKYNHVGSFIEQGTDALEIMVDFCHAHEMECFWSYRMNDTHDVSQLYGPLFFSPWKEKNPELLVGSKDNPPPFGRWTSVDYSHQTVRDRMFSFAEEVCRNYDVDGIELDFFRHPCFFKSVAWGEDASAQELEMMTDLMRRIRRMTEEVGMERGKPILIAIRIPDSAGYCEAIGLDVERWMEDDLVDMVFPTGYWRLNPWEYSMDWRDRFNVKVYAGLSRPRLVIDGPPNNRKYRESNAAYRGWASQLWESSPDGIYLYNYVNLDREHLTGPVFNELGSPATLRGNDKLYFQTYKSFIRASWYLHDADRFLNRTLINGEHPLVFFPGSEAEAELTVSEPALKQGDAPEDMRAELWLWIENIAAPEQIQVRFNGTLLSIASATLPSPSHEAFIKKERQGILDNAGWVAYEVDPSLIHDGSNRITFFTHPQAPKMLKLPTRIHEIALWVDYAPFGGNPLQAGK
jgi:hypothetical protein